MVSAVWTNARELVLARLPGPLRWLVLHPRLFYPLLLFLLLVLLLLFYRFGRRLVRTILLVLKMALLVAHVASLGRLFFSSESVTLWALVDAGTLPSRMIFHALMSPLYGAVRVARPFLRVIGVQMRALFFLLRFSLREIFLGYMTLACAGFFVAERYKWHERVIPLRYRVLPKPLLNFVLAMTLAMVVTILRGPLVVVTVCVVCYRTLRALRSDVQFRGTSGAPRGGQKTPTLALKGGPKNVDGPFLRDGSG